MQNTSPYIVFITIILMSGVELKAQQARNSINTYVGLVEINFNYERTVIQMSRAYGNLRVGAGRAGFLQAGEGTYINLSYAHVIGEKKGRIEADIGFKYMVTNSIDDPKFSEKFIPDIFIGYRYQKLPHGLVFRAGFNYPTIVNLGIGLAF